MYRVLRPFFFRGREHGLPPSLCTPFPRMILPVGQNQARTFETGDSFPRLILPIAVCARPSASLQYGQQNRLDASSLALFKEG